MSGKPRPPEDRFWGKVNKLGPVRWGMRSPCWEWTAALTTTGYGTMGSGGKGGGMVYAHRFSYELHTGKSAEGLFVLHKCDNRTCVRPDHLFLGTQADNMRDKMSKGREARGVTHGRTTKPEATPRGVEHGNAILTDTQVRQIRRRYASGGFTQHRLSELYSISQGAISQIISRKSWKHLK